MRKVGAYEAKTHLAELLDRVAAGEEILITRHRHPVARLVPADRPSQSAMNESLAALLAFGDEHELGPGLTIRELIEEGRA